jgi:hypothetical protein
MTDHSSRVYTGQQQTCTDVLLKSHCTHKLLSSALLCRNARTVAYTASINRSLCSIVSWVHRHLNRRNVLLQLHHQMLRLACKIAPLQQSACAEQQEKHKLKHTGTQHHHMRTQPPTADQLQVAQPAEINSSFSTPNQHTHTPTALLQTNTHQPRSSHA